MMNGGMRYEQGDIVLIPFPYSDLTESKKRSALIISNRPLTKTDDRICCLVTSRVHRNDIVIKERGISQGRLPFKSSVKTPRIFTIDTGIILKKLCTTRASFHEKVLTSLKKYIMGHRVHG